MGLQTIISRVFLVAVFFFNGISNLSNLPLACSHFEQTLKQLNTDYKAVNGSDFYLLEFLLANSYKLIAAWSGLEVVCTFTTVLKVKWGMWVLMFMLFIDAVPAWYERSPHSRATLLGDLAMAGGLLILICVVQGKQHEKAKKKAAEASQ